MQTPSVSARYTQAVLAAVLLTAGCGGASGTRAGSAHPRSTPTLFRIIAKMGSEVRTASGNRVTALSYEDPAQGAPASSGNSRYAASEVKVCAGAKPAQVVPDAFYLLFRDRRVIHADTTQIVRQPSLHTTTLAPGTCISGWVSFLIDDGSRPLYFVLTASSLVGWRIE
jgi:hypothetical protein